MFSDGGLLFRCSHEVCKNMIYNMQTSYYILIMQSRQIITLLTKLSNTPRREKGIEILLNRVLCCKDKKIHSFYNVQFVGK